MNVGELWGKQKDVKKTVAKARNKAFEGLYQSLGTKDGEGKVFKLTKSREWKTGDIDQVKCIKDGDVNLLVKDQEIQERWKEYFHRLFNEGQMSSWGTDR